MCQRETTAFHSIARAEKFAYNAIAYSEKPKPKKPITDRILKLKHQAL